jgi:hypothetical protein
MRDSPSLQRRVLVVVELVADLEELVVVTGLARVD